MTPRLAVPLLVVGLAWTAAQPTDRAWPATAHQATSRLAPGDSIVIHITNSMPHAMTITYEVQGERKPLGTVDANGERPVAIHDLQGDSVIVWATNGLPPHDIPHTFPTHPTAKLTWDL